MTDILGIIKTQREARGWSEYQLAERSGLPQSTIPSWYKKDMTPSFASLEKICDAFGITLSQFFADGVHILQQLQQKRPLFQQLVQRRDLIAVEVIFRFHFLRRFGRDRDIEVSFRPAVIFLASGTNAPRSPSPPKAGTHSALLKGIAHSGSHGETRVFPPSATARSCAAETPDGRLSKRLICRFLRSDSHHWFQRRKIQFYLGTAFQRRNG